MPFPPSTKSQSLKTNKRSGTLIVSDLKFRYPDSTQLLKKVNLKLSRGEWVAISGESGCGKTTLAMALNGLVPHSTGGHIGGEVSISGANPREIGPAEMSRHIGFLFQETASSFTGNTIEREIAFGLEQRGVQSTQINIEIEKVLKLTQTEEFRFRSPQTLSGGERQRCALAAVLALRPSILILDEPTAQLDPASKKEIIYLIDKIRREERTTIVWIEQPCPEITQLADQSWRMNGGELTSFTSNEKQKTATKAKRSVSSKETILQLESLSFNFPNSKDLIINLTLSIHRGEVLFLKGVNGSGKTTLFRLIMGLETPLSGDIKLSKQSILPLKTPERARNVAYLMQEPDQQLFESSVKEELMSGNLYRIPTGKQIKKKKKDDRPQKKDLALLRKEAEEKAFLTASEAEIIQYWDDPPQQLSYGFRKRVALAAIATTNPSLYLLDEPTVSLDQGGRLWLKNWIANQQKKGLSFLIISHDESFIAETGGNTITMDSINGQ